MNFQAVIGLEIHVELKTNSKMFSSAPVTYGEDANTAVSLLDIAFPGAMPTINKQVVVDAIKLCHVLNMNIDNELWFDRKNYFYSDLPKGFQITQHFRPIGKDGYMLIEGQKIGIERLHIEEDTCKQVHLSDCSLLDFNRSGIPLLEIVSKPEIHSGEQAKLFVDKIRSLVTYLGISDGKMEEGSLRCDVNISLRPIGSDHFGNKVEIKNLNSISNIQNAIDFEIDRQNKILLSGLTVEQETRRFDENKNETVLMRKKEGASDYRYLVEANIPPIHLSKEFVETAIKNIPELPEQKLKRYMELGLNEYDASLLLCNKDAAEYFEKVIENNAPIRLAANWINGDIQAVLNKKDISILGINISPENLAILLKMIEENKISHQQGKMVFEKMILTNKNPQIIVEELGISIINNSDTLLKIINEVLDNNPQSIVDYQKGKDNVTRYLIGQVMKVTNGQADPKLTNEILLEQLKGR